MNQYAEVRQEFAPTGRLRAALNMGNPVLAHSHTSRCKPAGTTIDLAVNLAQQLGVDVELLEFPTPGKAGEAIAQGRADVGFLAVDPQRAKTLHFSNPYVQIEGCYMVRNESRLRDSGEIDQPGTQLIVGVASAYALYLERHLKHAKLVAVPTSEGVADAYIAAPEIEAAAGVRQQLESDAKRIGGLRLLPTAFMVIRQAMVMSRQRSAASHAVLEAYITQQRQSGFITAALYRHGIEGATVLP